MAKTIITSKIILPYPPSKIRSNINNQEERQNISNLQILKKKESCVLVH